MPLCGPACSWAGTSRWTECGNTNIFLLQYKQQAGPKNPSKISILKVIVKVLKKVEKTTGLLELCKIESKISRDKILKITQKGSKIFWMSSSFQFTISKRKYKCSKGGQYYLHLVFLVVDVLEMTHFEGFCPQNGWKLLSLKNILYQTKTR